MENLVVRTTFLDLFDESSALGPFEGGRRLDVGPDATDLRQPQKVQCQPSDVEAAVGHPANSASVEPGVVWEAQQFGHLGSGMTPSSMAYPGYNATDTVFSAPPGMLNAPAAPNGSLLAVGQSSCQAPRRVSGAPTTVMLRNIPNRYTQNRLINLLDENGFRFAYDFVYLPMDFRNGVNLGYAFVNLVTHEDAMQIMQVFQGFSKWFYDSSKVCEISWAHPHQGLEEHVTRYRNSPVMHQCMPDEYKPMLFNRGARIPFPPPTKAIRAPKLRSVRDRPQCADAVAVGM